MAAWSHGRFSFCLQRDAGWLRVGSTALWYTSQPPMFSERNGYLVPFLTLGKWRFIIRRRLPRNC